MYLRYLLVLIVSYPLLFTSCTFITDNENTENIDAFPDIVLFRADIHVIEENNINIQADKIEIYSKLSKQIFNNTYFEQFNDNNEQTMNGTADFISMDNDSRNIEIIGNIDITLLEDESQVLGEYLYWDNENDLLTSKDNDPISISRDNGTFITGTGFSVNTLKQVINFSGPTNGTIYTGDEPLIKETPEEAVLTVDEASPSIDTQAATAVDSAPTTAQEEAAESLTAEKEQAALEEELSKELK